MTTRRLSKVKLAVAAAAAVLTLGALSAQAAEKSAEKSAESAAPAVTVLRATHLFDSVSGKLVSPGVLVISGKKILSVGNAVVPAGARVIELGDATLLPGFIDAHVHLSDAMSDNFYKDFYNGVLRFPAEQALYGARHAKDTLEAGFTSVRDVGSEDYIALGLRNAINAGVIPGPRMLVSNYPIGATAGHADQAPFPPEKIAPAGPIQGVCNGADQCRAAVRYQIKYGADVIKFMPSGGVLSLTDPVDVPELTADEMNAIVSEAHMWGRKVAAHCHGDLAAKMAIAAGVDSIEHGSFLKDDTLQLMKAKHVFLVPTLYAGFWVGQRADNFPPVIADKARAAAAQMMQMFERAARIGVPVAFGTDAGVEPHGTNAKEFWLMTQHGFTSAQSLMAGTANGAELLGVKDRVGTLEAGKLADVVAVPGDALAHIEATAHPLFVMKEGAVVVDGK
ncbi:MAG TPA: amidohydrolase family protein [Burkholderiaceae bacterium]|jgi:imidazolonepropionase-like amidohydrolase